MTKLIFFSSLLDCWDFSSGNTDFYKGSLIHGICISQCYQVLLTMAVRRLAPRLLLVPTAQWTSVCLLSNAPSMPTAQCTVVGRVPGSLTYGTGSHNSHSCSFVHGETPNFSCQKEGTEMRTVFYCHDADITVQLDSVYPYL